jgi:hypothetical protein
MFRFVYAKVCCRFCFNRKKKSAKAAEQRKLDAATQKPDDPSKTTNNKRHQPNQQQQPHDDDKYDGKVDRIGLQSGTAWQQKKKNETEADDEDENQGAKVVDDNEDLNNPDENEKVSVPLTITMIILTGYIFLGAIIFYKFESWDLVAAAYFCFITLSTIGFGDYVPGQNADTAANTATLQLIVTFIYILLGMSILAMCFDLMQEEIIAKFTWIGKKLGVVDKEDADIAAENNEKQLKQDEKLAKEGQDKFDHENNNSKKRGGGGEPVFVSENSNHYNGYSPAPSYSATAGNRSYANNITQRQQPAYLD